MTATTATKTKSKAKAKPATKAKPKAKRTTKKAPKFTSRAVIRIVEPGSQVDCEHCGERVKFQARMRHQQAICNIYSKNVWQRVEHFHAECYDEAGRPYGDPVD